jgi:hypothetical protein
MSTSSLLLASIPNGYTTSNPNNKQSVAEFDGQFYSPDDVNSFTNLMNLVQPPIQVVGPNNASQPGGESTLDIEWILTTGLNVSTVFWSVGDGGFLIEWVQQLADDPNPPQVHSVSYGEPEAFMSDNMTDRLNIEFQKLGVRGLTIISTSGDIGVADGFPGLPCARDHPDFPSSSPYTTSLGATFLTRPYASLVKPTHNQIPICTGASNVRGIPILCDATAELPCSADTGQGVCFCVFFFVGVCFCDMHLCVCVCMCVWCFRPCVCVCVYGVFVRSCVCTSKCCVHVSFVCIGLVGFWKRLLSNIIRLFATQASLPVVDSLASSTRRGIKLILWTNTSMRPSFHRRSTSIPRAADTTM